jgi:hypothetical protein
VVRGVAEPRPHGERVHGAQVSLAEERQYVAAALVHRRLRNMSVLERQQLPAWKRRREDESFVRVDRHTLRVIDHVKPEAVEVQNLVHRLGELEDVLPVPRTQLV